MLEYHCRARPRFVNQVRTVCRQYGRDAGVPAVGLFQSKLPLVKPQSPGFRAGKPNLEFLSAKTLVQKASALMLMVASGLPIGRELRSTGYFHVLGQKWIGSTGGLGLDHLPEVAMFKRTSRFHALCRICFAWRFADPGVVCVCVCVKNVDL